MATALQVIQTPDSAAALFHPDRRRVLSALAEADSAAGVARRLEMPRQTVNYHLHALENAGLVEMVERRMKGNCAERLVRATATAFVISSEALGELGVCEVRDRFSSDYLIAASTRVVRDLAVLRTRADKARKKLATLTLETEIRFAGAGERQAFTAELTATLARLAAKYNDDGAPGGRSFRVVVGALPKVKE
jgi:DNA-binding transcriptional ArsR family regulator